MQQQKFLQRKANVLGAMPRNRSHHTVLLRMEIGPASLKTSLVNPRKDQQNRHLTQQFQSYICTDNRCSNRNVYTFTAALFINTQLKISKYLLIMLWEETHDQIIKQSIIHPGKKGTKLIHATMCMGLENIFILW